MRQSFGAKPALATLVQACSIHKGSVSVLCLEQRMALSAAEVEQNFVVFREVVHQCRLVDARLQTDRRLVLHNFRERGWVVGAMVFLKVAQS